MSPDSRFVLVAGMRSSAVACLAQRARGASRRLTARRAASRNGGGTRGLRARSRARAGRWTSPSARDGRYVYVASSIADAIAVLARDRGTGALTQPPGRAGCLSQGGGGGRCMRRARARRGVERRASAPTAATSTASRRRSTCSARSRATASTGGLAQLPGRYGCFIRARRLRGCPEGRGLTVAVAVAVSPDGRNVYVASEDVYLGAVAIFRRLGG